MMTLVTLKNRSRSPILNRDLQFYKVFTLSLVYGYERIYKL